MATIANEETINRLFELIQGLNLQSQDGKQYEVEFKKTLTNYLSVLKQFQATQEEIQTTKAEEKQLEDKLDKWTSLYNDMLDSFKDSNGNIPGGANPMTLTRINGERGSGGSEEIEINQERVDSGLRV